MTQFLPPNLLALFAPRDPIPYLPPLEKLPHEKHHNQPYCGIAPYIREFEDPRDAPPPTRAETREERMERKRREKIERRQQEVETELKMWDPHNDPNAQGDAFKTLFVARVNYDTTESKLRREFEVYGPIKRIHMVYSKRSGKPRGYAFIEYEHERDMHCEYLPPEPGPLTLSAAPVPSRCLFPPPILPNLTLAMSFLLLPLLLIYLFFIHVCVFKKTNTKKFPHNVCVYVCVCVCV
uniref:U1 small nuclear ribonucleoprotein 70 kDa n=1 Tax=Myotis myotis TaxID=51298 RepID=A0A7J7QXW8_MYOMY|nr:small nuclear ribonucleoprotein U1 subunit 70 [Myotis myotis]